MAYVFRYSDATNTHSKINSEYSLFIEKTDFMKIYINKYNPI